MLMKPSKSNRVNVPLYKKRTSLTGKEIKYKRHYIYIYHNGLSCVDKESEASNLGEISSSFLAARMDITCNTF